MSFHNSPAMKDENNASIEGKVKRYVHQPLTFDHFGTRIQIKENGRVIISSQGVKVAGSDELEYDQIEVPAGLIFKIADAIKLTQTIKYVTLAEAAKMPKDVE